MIDMYNHSINFTKIINNALNTIIEDFICACKGYDEIYFDVFPNDIREYDKKFMIKEVNSLHRSVKNNFHMDLDGLHEYILYYILEFINESYDEFSIIEDIRSGLENYNVNDEDEYKYLISIETPEDLMSVAFADHDFKQVGEFFEIYKKNPEMLEYFDIDLEKYIRLMPEEIFLQYQASKDIDALNINEENDFRTIIMNMFKDFKIFLEHNQMYKIIYKRDEKIVQNYIKTYVTSYLRNSDILIHCEPHVGRGQVDFYFSIGKTKQAVVEVKLDSNNRYKDGLFYQTPTYALSVNPDRFFAPNKEFLAIFMLICFDNQKYIDSKNLIEDAKLLSEKYKINIEAILIDASGTLKTASKVKSFEEMGFGFE